MIYFNRDFFYFTKCLKSGERLPIQFTDEFVELDDFKGIAVDELTKESDIVDHSDAEDEPENEDKS